MNAMNSFLTGVVSTAARVVQSSAVVACLGLGLCAPRAAAQVTSAPASTTSSAWGQIQFSGSDGSSISLDHLGGDLPTVNIPRGIASVRIDSLLPALFAGKTVRVSSVDGGGLSSGQLRANSLVFTVGSDGRLIFTYAPSPYPGVYRVLIDSGSTSTVLKFAVPAATDPAARAGLSTR